ncbi:MAG: branched-chain amino acid ABC transporter permease, partial [Armatimonadota bacterium]
MADSLQEFLQQLINGVVLGSAYALIALGYTMVYGILRLINFAHGDVYMIGAYIAVFAAVPVTAAAVSLMGILHLGPAYSAVVAFLAVLLIAMGGSGLLGYAIERFVYRPLRKQSRLTVLIAAIGVSLFLEYAAQVQFGSEPRLFPQLIVQRAVFQAKSLTFSNQQLLIVSVSLGLALLLQFIVQKTSVGRAMRA